MSLPCDPNRNLCGRGRTQRLADFINEVGMLRLTPRSGYQFLGSGKENVAEHSHRTSVIGFVLARLAGADPARTALLCLFHDLAEARTGDFNYVNHIYNTAQARHALEHATAGTGLENDILPLWDELERNESLEARLAHDADQLDLIFNLKREQDLGNPYAAAWLDSSVSRLKTPEALELAAAVKETDHTDWWFRGPDASWWKKRR